MDETKQPAPATEFGAEAPGTQNVEKTSTTGKSSSDTLSRLATESEEAAKGKKAPEGSAPSPEPIAAPEARQANTRPGDIFDLSKQLQQAPAPEARTESTVSRPITAAEAQGPSGNWNSANFVNPLKALDEFWAAKKQNDDNLAFQKLLAAQAAFDLITPEYARIIVNDLKNIERDLPKELDTKKQIQMTERVAAGLQILNCRWECPVRLADAILKRELNNPQAQTEAFRLLYEAAKINPQLKNDPETAKTIEGCSSLYGDMAQSVKQAMEQAIISGTQASGQTAQERSAFQDNPQLVETLVAKGQKAQLESPDPYVHAREAEEQMKLRGVLSQEARQAHNRAIEAAKKIEHAKKESFNSVLGEIGQIKKDITGKQLALAKLQEQITAKNKESKTIAEAASALSAVRSEEERKAHSADMSESIGTMFNRAVKSITGEAEKENKAFEAKAEELAKTGGELQKLLAQKKALEADLKSSEGLLKDKQGRLAEIGKSIADKHVSYAKALLVDSDARLEDLVKAKAEGNEEQFNTSQALRLTDIITASQQLNRAEKISPELAKDEELKALKKQYGFVSTSIGENITNITPELQQELDDRFLAAVNRYNYQLPEGLNKAIAGGLEITKFQTELANELNGLKSYYPELEGDQKLRAALGLIGRGERITDEALAETATIQSKALKLGENLQTGVEAMQAFGPLMAQKQYKTAEEALKIGMENLKSVAKEQHDQLNEATQAFENCKDLNQMVGLRQQKEALENAVAVTEAKILDSIGKLYLTSDQVPEKQAEGAAKQEPGPGYKPEQALQVLNQAKEAFPGIEKNPLFQEHMKTAQGLQKDIKNMEIKARDDADKAKEAGIDLATTLTSWGAAAAAGVGAGALVVATGLMVAGAPVTVPAALAIVGITAAAGAVVGGVTKWGLSNAFDAKDKDLVRNFTKGAWIGGTSGLGGGGLKVGGMVLAEGLMLTKAGVNIYQGAKFADVYGKVASMAPLSKPVANILQGAKGNLAKEIQLGEEILEGHLKAGKITEQTYNAAKAALSSPVAPKGSSLHVYNALKDAGITMSEDALTTAGLTMSAASGVNGTKAIDAGWKALRAGMPEANLPSHAWYNVIGHGANFGKGMAHNIGNISKQVAFAAPYTVARVGLAGAALGTSTGTYNAHNYYSRFADGEINPETHDKWTAQEAAWKATEDTVVQTGIGLGTMGALNVVAKNPALIIEFKTQGAASAVTAVGNFFTKGAVSRAAAKFGKLAPIASTRSVIEGLSHNDGIIAPFARNVVPLGAGAGRRLQVAQEESIDDSTYIANRQSSLENTEIQVAEETQQQPQQILADQVPQTESQPSNKASEATAQEEEQQRETTTADAGQPATSPSPAGKPAESSGPPQLLSDT